MAEQTEHVKIKFSMNEVGMTAWYWANDDWRGLAERPASKPHLYEGFKQTVRNALTLQGILFTEVKEKE